MRATRTCLLSGGVFYKHITGFIYDRAFAYAGPLTEFAGYLDTQPANGGDADVVGGEAQYTRRFLFLPGALAGLGLDLNWTHVYARAALFGDTASAVANLGHPVVVRHAALPRMSPDVANLALTYDRGAVSARTAWQYEGASIYSFGDGTPTAGSTRCRRPPTPRVPRTSLAAIQGRGGPMARIECAAATGQPRARRARSERRPSTRRQSSRIRRGGRRSRQWATPRWPSGTAPRGASERSPGRGRTN